MYTDCIILSCMKALQSFHTKLIVDAYNLQACFKQIWAVWTLGVHDVLVVEGEINDTNILHKINGLPNSKRVVMILHISEHKQLRQQYMFVEYIDTFFMSQLQSHSQHDLLECEVIFQGFPTKLNALADKQWLENTLSADMIVQLQIYRMLEIGHKLDDLDPCYLPRTFIRKQYVNEEIFMEENVIFAVSGISEDHLLQLIPNDENVKRYDSRKLVEDETCRYYLIKREHEFSALSAAKDNVHWIHKHEKRFLLVENKWRHVTYSKTLRYGRCNIHRC
ncbi:hypothetical protein L9F63_017299 [Diploptera punctata]|uniref:Uncharacterized protein n=1 Tax=Diploptera punctata TaxID=6984 RepID=A0AAD8EH82_DIPPU|nr:hypothetical protein L9F63_017299 [Diploptera punctata]